jgi:hypothetical protein
MPDIQWQCLGCNYDVYVLAGLYSDIEPLAKAHNFPFDKYVPNTIEAGRRGDFALVIGVDRTGHADALRGHGADVVVQDLSEVDVRA